MTPAASSFPHPLYERYVLQPFFRDALEYYYGPMLAANKAHAVMLYKAGIIDLANAKALLQGLNDIEDTGPSTMAYTSGVEDLFFSIENRLIEGIGSAHGGNLQLGRSRNDLGYALTRLAIRPLLLDSINSLLELRTVTLLFARKHLDTVMPGYTHTQPAQPTTMAHYIAGVLAVLERDTRRLWVVHDTNNLSPLGAAAFTGTGFPIDREMSARLLGFDGVIPSTYDSIAASDNLTDVASALSSLAINLSRFTHDMLVWATQESGAIRLDDSFIQISSIMPQKRNPVVLEHLRARISRMLAQAQGIITQCHNIPFGDTQDIEDEIFPLLFGGLETSVEILSLYAAVIDTLHVNVDHLRQRATAGFTTVTELADTLVREVNVSFRQAHSVVTGLVAHALAHGLRPDDLTSDLLARIAREKIGRDVTLPDSALREALDPVAFVRKRAGYGGAAPSATAEILDAVERQIGADRERYQGAVRRLSEANDMLSREVEAILLRA